MKNIYVFILSLMISIAQSISAYNIQVRNLTNKDIGVVIGWCQGAIAAKGCPQIASHTPDRGAVFLRPNDSAIVSVPDDAFFLMNYGEGKISLQNGTLTDTGNVVYGFGTVLTVSRLVIAYPKNSAFNPSNVAGRYNVRVNIVSASSGPEFRLCFKDFPDECFNP